jgi:hypothetical protein
MAAALLYAAGTDRHARAALAMTTGHDHSPVSGLLSVVVNWWCRGSEKETTMAILQQLLSDAELKNLDQKELDALKAAITNEINTSPQIRDILKPKVYQVYSQLKPGSAPKGP